MIQIIFNINKQLKSLQTQSLATQMKLFNAFVAASVVSTSLIAASRAEAKNGWIKAGCGSRNANNSGCLYYRVYRRKNPFVYVDVESTFADKGSYLRAIKQIDCNSWRFRSRLLWEDDGWGSWGSWSDFLPGTIGESGASSVCG